MTAPTPPSLPMPDAEVRQALADALDQHQPVDDSRGETKSCTCGLLFGIQHRENGHYGSHRLDVLTAAARDACLAQVPDGEREALAGLIADGLVAYFQKVDFREQPWTDEEIDEERTIAMSGQARWSADAVLAAGYRRPEPTPDAATEPAPNLDVRADAASEPTPDGDREALARLHEMGPVLDRCRADRPAVHVVEPRLRRRRSLNEGDRMTSTRPEPTPDGERPDLDALAELLGAATPGPWTCFGDHLVWPSEKGPACNDPVASTSEAHPGAGELIAAAVNALPALMAEVRAHRADDSRVVREVVDLHLAALDHAIEVYAGPDDDTLPMLRDLRSLLAADDTEAES